MEKKKSKKWWIIGGVILLLIVIGALSSEDKEGTKSGDKQAKASEAPSLNIPAKQKAFIDAVTESIGKYQSAGNELKKSAVRTERKKAISKALNNTLSITDWVGTLRDMETTSERNAYISIQIEGSKFRVQTWNNELSDMIAKTLIPEGSELYKQVAELAKGNKVKFSGSFASGDDDFVDEQSMTENGSMTDPEFTVKFKSINKVE